MTDPDFDRPIATVEDIDKRIVRWQSREYVAEVVLCALATAAGEEVSPEMPPERRDAVDRGHDRAQHGFARVDHAHGSALAGEPR